MVLFKSADKTFFTGEINELFKVLNKLRLGQKKRDVREIKKELREKKRCLKFINNDHKQH